MDRRPHATQMIRLSPTEPVSSSTPLGETNIPEPATECCKKHELLLCPDQWRSYEMKSKFLKRSEIRLGYFLAKACFLSNHKRNWQFWLAEIWGSLVFSSQLTTLKSLNSRPYKGTPTILRSQSESMWWMHALLFTWYVFPRKWMNEIRHIILL